MKVKEQAIKELETLKPAEVMMVYDLILLFKGNMPEQRVKERLPAYIRVRNALKQCKCSISEDILSAREDRI
ncbi:MAG: hypothetical protein QME81_19565 [bacterium]|nr:hypothetical protein [bacterium]